nr:MAG TPA: hypothetical protein [Inoviridae sp.]
MVESYSLIFIFIGKSYKFCKIISTIQLPIKIKTSKPKAIS